MIHAESEGPVSELKMTRLADELNYAAEYAPFVTKNVAELLRKAASALTARASPTAEEGNVTLSCGCKSHYLGFPSQWSGQDREGNDCITYGQLCEKHFTEYDAEPAQYDLTTLKERADG